MNNKLKSRTAARERVAAVIAADLVPPTAPPRVSGVELEYSRPFHNVRPEGKYGLAIKLTPATGGAERVHAAVLTCSAREVVDALRRLAHEIELDYAAPADLGPRKPPRRDTRRRGGR